MRGMVPPDADSTVSQIRYAVVYVPKRSRGRFPQGSVDIVETDMAAMQKADPENRQFAAVLSGPSKSSEGQMIYYLVEWLGVEP